MGAFTYTEAGDIVNAALEFYVKGPALSQSKQERPLLAALDSSKATFPGGKEYISTPVQGRYMSNQTAFFAGYNGGDELTFQQADDIVRAKYKWYEVHAGLKITWSELKQDGVHISDNNKKTESSGIDVTRLTGILENRLADFSESWARRMNSMLWGDGTQDSKQVPGVRALITDTPTTGTTGGINRADPDGNSENLTWWQHRARLSSLGNALVASATNQTMTKGLRQEIRQLGRFGGKNFALFCGSGFIEKLEEEVHEKGVYTQEGFINNGKNDIGMADIWLRGMGKFSYDPTLDDIGLSNRCYVFAKNRLRLRPMESEEDKLLNPERPYNYAMFFRSMTWTGGLEVFQLNACGVYAAQ